MNNKSAIILLAVLSVGLGLGLYFRHQDAVEQKAKDDSQIAKLEGTVKDTEGKLTEQKKVNDTLSTNLVAKTEEAKTLTTKVAATTAELTQTKDALTKSQGETKAAQAEIKVAQAETKKAEAATKAAQAETKQVETRMTAALDEAKAKAEADAKAAAARLAATEKSKAEEIAKRDANIKDLEETRTQLNAKIAGLNADIAKLNSTIGTLNARITLIEGELQVNGDLTVYGGVELDATPSTGNSRTTSVLVPATSRLVTTGADTRIDIRGAQDIDLLGTVVAGGVITESGVSWTGPDSSVEVHAGQQLFVDTGVLAAGHVFLQGGSA